MGIVIPLKFIAIVEFLKDEEFILSGIIERKLNKKAKLLSLVKKYYSTIYDQSLRDTVDFVESGLEYDLKKMLDFLSTRLYKFDNGRIFYCNVHLQELHFIQTEIDSYLIESYSLFKYASYMDCKNLYRFIKNSIENNQVDYYGRLNSSIEEFSDNHIHLGSSLSYHHLLDQIVKDPRSVDYKKTPDDLYFDFSSNEEKKSHVYMFCCFEILLLKYIFCKNNDSYKSQIKFEDNLKDIKNILKKLVKNHSGQNIDELRKIYDDISFYNVRDDKIQKHFINIEDNRLENFLLKSIVKSFSKDNQKIIEGDKYLISLFIYCLICEKEYEDIFEYINLYFTLRNKIKMNLVQHHRRKGYNFFSSYFRSGYVKLNKNGTQNLEKQYFEYLNSLYHKKIKTNIEVRFSFFDYIQDTELVFKSLIDALYKFNNQREKNNNLSVLLHFTKSGDDTFKMYRFFKKRDEIYENLKNIQELLTNSKYRIDLYDNFTSNIFDLFAGIDCAGNELNIPPEVFAPIYRYLKNAIETTGIIHDGIRRDEKERRLKNFKYTYHVGEDFRDILSGVRSIFEAIIFLDLKNNDRLGHALALGIDPSSIESEDIMISKQEALDNALFAYMVLYTQNKLTKQAKYYEEMIKELSIDIYGNVESSYSITDHIHAWLLRRNCPRAIIELGNRFNSYGEKQNFFNIKDSIKKSLDYNESGIDYRYLRASVPDFLEHIPDYACDFLNKYEYIKNNKNAFEIFEMYCCDKEVFKRGKKTYNRYKVKSDVYEFLQDFLMENLVAKREIVIETNPTSNLLIGKINSFKEHPIIRFRPVTKKIKVNKFKMRKKRLRVLINTDNPGIFNTSLMQEYYQIFAAHKDEYGDELMIEYLNEIVKEGNLIFNNKDF